MPVEPLNWISWLVARQRMPEIWDGWRYQQEHADQAMVNSLHRGNVPYRGRAYEPRSSRTRQIALHDVVAGLLALRDPRFFYLPFAEEAEYKAIEWGLPLGNYQRQITVKRTAELVGVELAWDQFHDDLIRFELPAGVATAPQAPEQIAKATAAETTSIEQLAEWIFAQHSDNAPTTFQNLCEAAAGKFEGFKKADAREAYRRVYDTRPHRPPVAGWTLRTPYRERWRDEHS
jgi:hypothetical protein